MNRWHATLSGINSRFPFNILPKYCAFRKPIVSLRDRTTSAKVHLYYVQKALAVRFQVCISLCLKMSWQYRTGTTFTAFLRMMALFLRLGKFVMLLSTKHNYNSPRNF